MGEFTQSLFGYKKKEVDVFLTEVKEFENNIKVIQKLLGHLNQKNHELVTAIEKSMLELQVISKKEIKIQEQVFKRLQDTYNDFL